MQGLIIPQLFFLSLYLPTFLTCFKVNPSVISVEYTGAVNRGLTIGQSDTAFKAKPEILVAAFSNPEQDYQSAVASYV